MTMPTTAPPDEPPTGSDAHSQLLLKLLFQALHVNDPLLNEAAAAFLVQFGTRPVSRLVQVAVNRKNRRPHRLRALTVIGRIGKLSSADDRLSLHVLLLEHDPMLREVAHKVLPALGIPVGPPKPTTAKKPLAKSGTKALGSSRRSRTP